MQGGAREPRILAGKYRLGERVAHGGMGSVWRAEHLHLHMPVAVKLMAPKMLASEAFRVRFEREARAVAQLRSRHVVTVHDYGFDGDEPFLVMELLDGEDLAARLRRERKLPPEATALIVGQIARALERAHAAGIVHRDLKPGNVFLAHIDDEEVVKVLDFGIAKAFGDGASDDVTGDDEVLGTPHYMSPEQIRKSGAIDPRADLWALGVIIYRMLTGALPFSGETRGDVVVRVCSEPAMPPSMRDPSLGPALDLFFERALAKLPEDRFESARALALCLDQALGNGASSQRGSIPDFGAGTFPPGALPSHPLLPGTLSPGTIPPGSFGPVPTPPPGALPHGGVPHGAAGPPSSAPGVLPGFGSATLPPRATPGLLPPGMPPSARTPVPGMPLAAAQGREGGDTTLSLLPTHVQPGPREPDRARRRLVVTGLAIAVLAGGIAVPVGLGILGGEGDTSPDAAASAEPPAATGDLSGSPVVLPAGPPSAGASGEPSAEAAGASSGEPSAEPSAEPSMSASAPAAPARPPQNKRRRVVIGL